MKYVISNIIGFCVIFLMSLPASIASEFKSEILREAAAKNGYKVPSKVNPKFDENKSSLGKLFFESEKLSFNASTSCSNCHLDEFSSTDGLPIAIGIGGHGKGLERVKGGGAIVPRNALPLWGRASPDFTTFFWDGKVEEKDGKVISQFGSTIPELDAVTTAISLPFVEIREMVSDDEYVKSQLMTETTGSAESIQKELVQRVINEINKGTELANAFDISVQSLEFVHVAKSIKHFFADKFRLRESKFSRFFEGQSTLSLAEIDGGLIFYGKGKCSNCHSGPHFSDFKFHTIVMPQFGFGKNGFGVDYGRFNSTFDARDQYRFRTPPLHNVEKTEPYGHSGSVDSLRQIIEMHYDPLKYINTEAMNGRERRELFSIMARVDNEQPIGSALTGLELTNLEKFLNALSF